MKNIKNSWLSREALALGLYALGLSILIVLFFFEPGRFFRFIIESAVLGAGIYGIYAQSMIYRIKARPSWNKKRQLKYFFNVSYIGLLLVSLILVLNNHYSTASVILPFALYVVYLQYTEFKKRELFYETLDENSKTFIN